MHPCSLISAFVIHLLESFISRPATSKISIFYLVSVAEETGLSFVLSETPKTGFLVSGPHILSSALASVYIFLVKPILQIIWTPWFIVFVPVIKSGIKCT